MDSMKLIELTIGGLVTLGAAYAGARFAFKFNREQQATALRDSRIEECNRAMLNLFRQFNALASYRKQRLEPHRESGGRHLMVQASPPQDAVPLTVDVAALAFLLSGDAHELPMEIAQLDERYRTCVQLINARSAIHHEEYQPALEEAMKQHGATDRLNGKLVEALVGPRIVESLRSATDDLYEIVDSAISAFIDAGLTHPARIKQVFPGAKIIGFAPKDSTSAKTVEAS